MKRLATAALLSVFLASPLAAIDLGEMTDAERQIFGDEVRAYLLQNPDILREMLALLEQRETVAQGANDAALVQVNAEALFNDGYSFVGGNPDGDVVVVEFLDYKCGFCKKAHPEVAELIKSDGNIRYIIKEFPILGEQSVLASRFAISVLQNADGPTYARVHDELMTFRGEITDESLRRLASTLELDPDTIMAGMNVPAVDQVIGQNHALAQLMQINGTPSFIMGDQMMRGYVPLAGMMQVVAELRQP